MHALANWATGFCTLDYFFSWNNATFQLNLHLLTWHGLIKINMMIQRYDTIRSSIFYWESSRLFQKERKINCEFKKMVECREKIFNNNNGFLSGILLCKRAKWLTDKKSVRHTHKQGIFYKVLIVIIIIGKIWSIIFFENSCKILLWCLRRWLSTAKPTEKGTQRHTHKNTRHLSNHTSKTPY